MADVEHLERALKHGLELFFGYVAQHVRANPERFKMTLVLDDSTRFEAWREPIRDGRSGDIIVKVELPNH